jgi:hypothetical protein
MNASEDVNPAVIASLSRQAERFGYRLIKMSAIGLDMTRMRMENTALREMLEDATQQIHGEWGSGTREPYDWLPEMEQHICGQKTGHQRAKRQERRWTYNNRDYRCIEIRCELCDARVGRVDLPA